MSIDHAYVAYAPCGCWVGVVSDTPGYAEETACSVAEFIRDGCHIARMSMEDWRCDSTTPVWLQCPHGANPEAQ